MSNLKKIITGDMATISQQDIDADVIYELTDYPIGGITNLQMAAALTEAYNWFYHKGDTFICLDNGTYVKGRSYKFTGSSWVLVTEYDTTPTEGSGNPVTSGGVKSYVDGIVGNINTILEGLL